jgi:DNA-binding PadR family transcriptional regulator
MKLQKGAYFVLGMIGAGCRSGYEISKMAEITSRFFWAAGDGQVYPQLRKLADAGLIEGEREAQGERERNVYELTDEGRRTLDDWLQSSAAPMMELRDEGLLKLFFSERLTTGQLREQVAVVRRAHQGAIEHLREIEPVARERLSALLTQQHGLAVHQAAVDWCDRLDTQLAEARPNTRAATTLRKIL